MCLRIASPIRVGRGFVDGGVRCGQGRRAHPLRSTMLIVSCFFAHVSIVSQIVRSFSTVVPCLSAPPSLSDLAGRGCRPIRLPASFLRAARAPTAAMHRRCSPSPRSGIIDHRRRLRRRSKFRPASLRSGAAIVRRRDTQTLRQQSAAAAAVRSVSATAGPSTCMRPPVARPRCPLLRRCASPSSTPRRPRRPLLRAPRIEAHRRRLWPALARLFSSCLVIAC